MFTTNSLSVIVGIAFVMVSCATPGRGAPSVASGLEWMPEQSDRILWPFTLGDQYIQEKYPHEPSIELKPPTSPPSVPYWQRALGDLSEQNTYPLQPSFELQPPPPPPSVPLTTPKPGDQSSGEQVTDQDLENQITQGPELDTDLVSGEDSDEQATDQAKEHFLEQLTNHDIDYEKYRSYMPEKVIEYPQPLSDLHSYQLERKRLIEMYMDYMKIREMSAYGSKNWFDEKDPEISNPNSIWRLRRNAEFSDDYTNSGGAGSSSYSQASASAGSGLDFSEIEAPAISAYEMFSQNQQQEYTPDAPYDYYSANVYSPPQYPVLRFGGADGTPKSETGFGITASVAGPSHGAFSSSSSSDDGNGKKTLAVHAERF